VQQLRRENPALRLGFIFYIAVLTDQENVRQWRYQRTDHYKERKNERTKEQKNKRTKEQKNK
jgi:hypothetical protein